MTTDTDDYVWLYRRHINETKVDAIRVHRSRWLAQALVEDDPQSIAPERIRLYFGTDRVDFWLAHSDLNDND